MKRLLAVMLALLTIFSVMTVPAVAHNVPAGEYAVHYVQYGDLNYDGSVAAADALIVLQSVVGKATLDEHQSQVGDVDDDNSVAAADALLILQYVVGKVLWFNVDDYYIIEKADVTPPTGNYIADYDKSKSVNGAYVQDPTADTGFVIDLSSIEPNTMYRLSSAPLKPTGIGGSTDFPRLIHSLQGLVNRDFGMDEKHTSMMICATETADTDWLAQMNGEGSIMEYSERGLKEVRINSWDAFLETFLPVIKSCGIILWDGNVPATANVAATICGLDGYLPVLANSPLHTILVEKGVPVKQSLVGLFKNGQRGEKIADTNLISTGSAKNDAYRWALEKYFPRCSSRYLAYTLDGAPCIKDYAAYEDNPTALLPDAGTNCIANHDYLIARRCFFFDLAPYALEAACDDPAQQNDQADWGTDNETMLMLFQARYDRAKGAFGALMGFPPWWVKYTSFKEQGFQDEVWIEWLYCEYVTCYNMAKEADAAQPAQMTNGSVFYKYIPQTTTYTNNPASEMLTYDKNTYYYTIYVGDYDSSAWLKKHMHTMWMQRGGDKKRGTLPLMWSINPNLSDRVPVIFEYLYNNKSELDYFTGGDGGAGYIIPDALFHDKKLAFMGETRPVGNAAAGNVFAKLSHTYYKRFDMDITGFLINGANGNISSNMAATVAKYSPIGGFYNDGQAGLYKSGNSRFVGCLSGITKGNTTNSTNEMYNFAMGAKNKGINFGAYRTVCWTPSEISAAVTSFQTYAAGKGLAAKYCDPYTYFDLIRQSGQGIDL